MVGQLETTFVYDAFGKLAAEYENTTSPINQTTKFLTQDHLGTPRVVTNSSGAVVSRHDYTAFGEEIYAGTGSRNTNDKYSITDGLRQQFTGYERDGESSLDYAQARYYNSEHGRFTTIDPLSASATIRNPQTFNRYSYALNSPYKFTDPLGLSAQCSSDENANGSCVDYESASAERERERNAKPPTVVLDIKRRQKTYKVIGKTAADAIANIKKGVVLKDTLKLQPFTQNFRHRQNFLQPLSLCL